MIEVLRDKYNPKERYYRLPSSIELCMTNPTFAEHRVTDEKWLLQAEWILLLMWVFILLLLARTRELSPTKKPISKQ